MVETQLCKLRGIQDTFVGRPYSMFVKCLASGIVPLRFYLEICFLGDVRTNVLLLV